MTLAQETAYSEFLESVRKLIHAYAMVEISVIQRTYQPAIHQIHERRLAKARTNVIGKLNILKATRFEYWKETPYHKVKDILDQHRIYGF